MIQRRINTSAAYSVVKIAKLVVTLFCICSEGTLQRSENHEKHRNIRSGIPDNQQKIRIVQAGASPLPPSVLPLDLSVISSENLPQNHRYLPEIGNGHIATVIQSDSVFMNCLYNGENSTSHRARIPSTSGYYITSTKPSGLKRFYSLDVGRGIFTETHISAAANITVRTYAHRLYKSTLVTELILSRAGDNTTEVTITAGLNSGGPSQDIEFTDEGQGIIHGKTYQAEHPTLAHTVDFYMKVSAPLSGVITLSPDNMTQTYLSLTVIDFDRDHVVNEYELALMSFQEGTLLSSHVNEWSKVWTEGRIDVEGDDNIAKLNYASLYYILSSLPSDGDKENLGFCGLSPGSLAHGEAASEYMGHVFWDQEILMFPPIVLLFPDLGRVIISSRTRNLESARQHASMTGYDGARFPWETALTGMDISTWAPAGEYQIHVTGDVALMIRQYWQLTHDTELMVNQSGAETVWETAEYWLSRATYDMDSDAYKILDVMPPDYLHFPVNDSAYTNSVASINLKFANQLCREFGRPENNAWEEVGNKLNLPYDALLNYHPEFENFSVYDGVQQSDVVLLGFPLAVAMNSSTRASDLLIYENLTAVESSSAATWTAFLQGWLELSNETKAAELFQRIRLSAQQPFLVWSEYAYGIGATNSLSAASGYLQSVLFGYGGARFHDNNFTFDPKLIPGTTKVKFEGLNYRGCSFDLEYTSTSMILSLKSIEKGHRSLDVLFKERVNWMEMIEGQHLQIKRQSFIIRTSQ